MLHGLTIINPLDFQEWDKLILAKKTSSFFLSSNWAKVLFESYHYRPVYFTILKENKISTVVPCMEVKSAFTGKRGVSLPFTDYCEFIGEDKAELWEVINYIFAYGKDAGWKTIELRSGNCLYDFFPPSSFYYSHTLTLSDNDKQIFSNFRDSTRRNIKKAAKEGVTVKICNSKEFLDEFYRLNCMTRRDHGLPPQPYYFFSKIYEHVISKNLGIIVLAEYKNKNIAGAVFFHFRDKAIFKYGASDKGYLNLRANNIVMWEAIKWYARNGFKELSFGRTEAENYGLLQFKKGWGGKEHPIEYYKYNIKNEAFVKDTPKVSEMQNMVFHNMPISLLKIAGSLLYKHIG